MMSVWPFSGHFWVPTARDELRGKKEQGKNENIIERRHMENIGKLRDVRLGAMPG